MANISLETKARERDERDSANGGHGTMRGCIHNVTLRGKPKQRSRIGTFGLDTSILKDDVAAASQYSRTE